MMSVATHHRHCREPHQPAAAHKHEHDERAADGGVVSILNNGRLLATWLDKLVKSEFFVPCEEHAHLKKNERMYYCMTCGDGHSKCRHCLTGHDAHYVMQLRRYVYNDVVNLADISLFVDPSGIQSYSINQAPVIFVKQRPHNHDGKQSSKDSCVVCRRSLKEGHSFCSLECKVTSAAGWGDGIDALLPECANVSHLPKVAKPATPKARPQKPPPPASPRKVERRSTSPMHATSADKDDSSSECSAQTGTKRSCSRGPSPSSSRRKQSHPRQSPPI
mmetsp:Transcript_4009/g.10128  ORF Transcript_4009/g.10128 Transcript_4009/m.10128 type:complete len:276 (+) Transcript_4009:279-1106(+)